MISAFLGGSLSLAPSFPIVNAQSSDLSTQLNPLNGLDRNVIFPTANFCAGNSLSTSSLTIAKNNPVSPIALFAMRVTNNGVSGSVVISQNHPSTFCISPGLLTVVENPTGCAVRGSICNPFYQLTIGGLLVSSASCNANVLPGQALVCTITNNLRSNSIGGFP